MNKSDSKFNPNNGVLLNQHVYIYYRWCGWIKEQQGKPFGAFFFRDFARQELEEKNEQN